MILQSLTPCQVIENNNHETINLIDNMTNFLSSAPLLDHKSYQQNDRCSFRSKFTKGECQNVKKKQLSCPLIKQQVITIVYVHV